MTTTYNRNFGDTVPWTDDCVQVHATANTSGSITVPGGTQLTYKAVFDINRAANNIFFRRGAAPTIPGANVVATQQYNQFNPDELYVNGGDLIYYITPDTVAYFGIRFILVQNGS